MAAHYSRLGLSLIKHVTSSEFWFTNKDMTASWIIWQLDGRPKLTFQCHIIINNQITRFVLYADCRQSKEVTMAIVLISALHHLIVHCIIIAHLYNIGQWAMHCNKRIHVMHTGTILKRQSLRKKSDKMNNYLNFCLLRNSWLPVVHSKYFGKQVIQTPPKTKWMYTCKVKKTT